MIQLRKYTTTIIFVIFFSFLLCEKSRIDFLEVAKLQAMKEGFDIDSCDIMTMSGEKFAEKFTIVMGNERYRMIQRKIDELYVVMINKKGYTKGSAVYYFIDKKGKILFSDHQK